ncbi:MAG: DUF4254 domain-containing protein [Microbacter sp.]
MFSKHCVDIFELATMKYHETDHVDAPMPALYPEQSIDGILFKKNWIDAVQWHLEDIIRDPLIDPVEALKIKRRIDASNQERTDVVEEIDGYFLNKYQNIDRRNDATINTESPAWAIDRLSILVLKIFHMNEETKRHDATNEHRATCENKLRVLLEQKEDLMTSIDQLLSDIEQGKKWMKVYKQMKMYNDPTLNPVLYQSK